MKYILEFNPIFEEALPLNLAKKYVKIGEERNPVTTAKMDVIFNNKQRIYLPIVKKVKSTVEPQIASFLKEIGYGIKDYIGNLAFKLDNPKREVKIGKLLSQNKREDLRDLFLGDPIRELATQQAEYSVVVSRHPYDVAGMSCGTGREPWHTSCLNIQHIGGGTGQNAHYVPKEIKNGTLTAYYIKTTDKNINSPLGRVNVKPYKKESELNQKDKQKCYFPDTRVYGSFPPDAILALKEWIISWQGDLTGDFFKWKGCYDYKGTAYHIGVSSGMDITEIEYEEGEYAEEEFDDNNFDDDECPDYHIMDARDQMSEVGDFLDFVRDNTTEYEITDWALYSQNIGWDGCEITSDSYIKIKTTGLVLDGTYPHQPFANGKYSDHSLGMMVEVIHTYDLTLKKYDLDGLGGYLMDSDGEYLEVYGVLKFEEVTIENDQSDDLLFAGNSRFPWERKNLNNFQFYNDTLIVDNCSIQSTINILEMIITLRPNRSFLTTLHISNVLGSDGKVIDLNTAPDDKGYIQHLSNLVDRYIMQNSSLKVTFDPEMER